jgi:hypothetical protein
LTLLIKDANTTTQSISTQADMGGNLVPVHAPAAIAAGIATPVGPTAPLPVINTAGAAAIDGSGTVVTGGTAQTLFAGVVPGNGYLVANNSRVLSTTEFRVIPVPAHTGSQPRDVQQARRSKQ